MQYEAAAAPAVAEAAPAIVLKPAAAVSSTVAVEMVLRIDRSFPEEVHRRGGSGFPPQFQIATGNGSAV